MPGDYLNVKRRGGQTSGLENAPDPETSVGMPLFSFRKEIFCCFGFQERFFQRGEGGGVIGTIHIPTTPGKIIKSKCQLARFIKIQNEMIFEIKVFIVLIFRGEADIFAILTFWRTIDTIAT
jgi:hypothetical protein